MACRAALPRVAFRAPISASPPASSFPSQISRSAFPPRRGNNSDRDMFSSVV